MFTKTASAPVIWHIVVAAYGHVLVGQITANDESGLSLKEASVIRRWGTTRGIGQLCIEGRQSETVTDPVGTVHLPRSSVIYVAEAPKWN